MKNKRCPKCNVLKPAPQAALGNYDAGSACGTLFCAVKGLRPGGAFTYKNSDAREMRAWMCANCGYTEFYAPQPTGLSSALNRKRF